MSALTESAVTFETAPPVVQQLYLRTLHEAYSAGGEFNPVIVPGHDGAVRAENYLPEDYTHDLVRPDLPYRGVASVVASTGAYPRHAHPDGAGTDSFEAVADSHDTGFSDASLNEPPAPRSWDTIYGPVDQQFAMSQNVDTLGAPDDATEIAKLEELWGLVNGDKPAKGIARVEQVWHTELDKSDNFSNNETEQIFDNAHPIRRHRATRERGSFSRFLRRTVSFIGYTTLATADLVAANALYQVHSWHL